MSIISKRISADTLTPVLAYLKITSHSSKLKKYSFLLESAEKDRAKGRFSVIGFMPDLVFKCDLKNSYLNDDPFASQKFIKQKGEPLDNLRDLIKKSELDIKSTKTEANQNYDQLLPSVASGLFGYLNYDTIRLMEKMPDRNLKDELGIAQSTFIRPQIILVFDNLFDTVLICAPNFRGYSKQQCEEKITLVELILKKPYTKKFQPLPKKAGVNDVFTSNYSQSEYCKTVVKAKEYIKNGDVFQVLPSQRFSAPFAHEPFSFYRALRSINPSPFLFFFDFGNFQLTGSSPEIMVSLKNKKITVRPLAGTRKRGKNQEEDHKIANELLHDEKEKAEHLMLIDLGRNDVGKVAEVGSVETVEKMVIENYSHVMHLSSTVVGKIKKGIDALDVLISAFPAGTVSGAPKLRAMEIIEELEKVKRSFYSGCVGYFASNGDMETCITLRSALIKNKKIYLQAGAGIVYDSDPESEYQECLNKTRALVEAYKKCPEY